MTIRERLHYHLGRLWTASPPLTGVGLLMLAALALSLVGLVLDPRAVTGAPVWLKPAKFAASTAIYSLTLAWAFTYLTNWPRMRRLVGWTTAVVFVLEVAIIDIQAWRGTTSHFNVGTTLDGVLFAVMGLAIVIQTVTSIATAVALWRQVFADPALGRALRLGMTLTIAGALTGGLMTRPTAVQLDEARATGRLAVVGAHTVGAPDGGPGLPGTGWSTEHGDLRVAHFVGLHALQALPVVALLLPRRRFDDRRRVRAVVIAGASYAALFALLLWQAMRGQSVLLPDAATAIAFAAWGLTTALSMGAALVHRRPAALRAAIVG
jgi:energy-converting hydrogenase Eha subunit F